MDKSEFVAPVSEDLECSICSNVMIDPRSCSEGHPFCLNCIRDWLARNPTCPSDRRDLTEAQLTKLRPLESIISKLEVWCPQALAAKAGKRKRESGKSGCDWTGQLCYREAHVADTCPLTVLSCTLEGCSKRVPRHDLAGHVKECKFRVLACAHCGEGCRDKDMQPHLRQCPAVLQTCRHGCGRKFPRRDTDKHRDECPALKIPCPFAGCRAKAPRCDLQAHKVACDFRPLVCDYCRRGVAAREMEVHVSECDQMPVIGRIVRWFRSKVER